MHNPKLPNIQTVLLPTVHSTYPWLQDCALGHVIWVTGCRDMINLKQQYYEKGFFTFELMTRISVKS